MTIEIRMLQFIISRHLSFIDLCGPCLTVRNSCFGLGHSHPYHRPDSAFGSGNVVVYTSAGQLGLLKVRRYGEIVRQAERSRIVTLVRSYHKRGRDLKDLLDNIEL
jgi:hypothetical protein